MKVAITGSSGFLGTALVNALTARGDEVVRVVRRPPTATNERRWDPNHGTIDDDAVSGADAVVHLAGTSIGAARWTKGHKREVLETRVKGTSLLARAIVGAANPPATFVSGSANGYYGDRGDEILTEDSSLGEGFRAEVCRQWEAATEPVASAGIRTVITRSSLVFDRSGGLLPFLLIPFRLFAGGPIGSGRQWISWVSLRDQTAAVLFALDQPTLEGPVNVGAPEPVREHDLAKAIGTAMHRPSFVRVPTWAVRLGAGRERADEVLLSSQRMVPAKLFDHGFRFADPEIGPALAEMFRKP